MEASDPVAIRAAQCAEPARRPPRYGALRQQVVTAARQEKMMVVAEGGSLFHMDMTMIVDGNTGIEHSLPQGAIYEDVDDHGRG